jgi:hypothetical protein
VWPVAAIYTATTAAAEAVSIREEAMAKAEKMNRGVKRDKHGDKGGSEIKLPDGIHSIDGHGNIFASLPEMSRVMPKYFTFAELEAAVTGGKLTALSAEDLAGIQSALARK